jgi:hypothetical protein
MARDIVRAMRWSGRAFVTSIAADGLEHAA